MLKKERLGQVESMIFEETCLSLASNWVRLAYVACSRLLDAVILDDQ